MQADSSQEPIGYCRSSLAVLFFCIAWECQCRRGRGRKEPGYWDGEGGIPQPVGCSRAAHGGGGLLLTRFPCLSSFRFSAKIFFSLSRSSCLCAALHVLLCARSVFGSRVHKISLRTKEKLGIAWSKHGCSLPVLASYLVNVSWGEFCVSPASRAQSVHAHLAMGSGALGALCAVIHSTKSAMRGACWWLTLFFLFIAEPAAASACWQIIHPSPRHVPKAQLQ